MPSRVPSAAPSTSSLSGTDTARPARSRRRCASSRGKPSAAAIGPSSPPKATHARGKAASTERSRPAADGCFANVKGSGAEEEEEEDDDDDNDEDDVESSDKGLLAEETEGASADKFPPCRASAVRAASTAAGANGNDSR